MLPAPRKRFGQHFLHDRATLTRIIAAINPQPDDHLVEIGPGRGALTTQLLPVNRRLTAIELDRDLIPTLAALCAPLGDLVIYQSDALKFDFSQLINHGGALRLVGNLPYNVATPIIFHILDQLHPISAAHLQTMFDMHFMLQHEVVERLIAQPGEKNYGRLSIMMQTRCQVERLFSVAAGAFYPPPKVASAFIRLQPHQMPLIPVSLYPQFAELVRRAFSQRRKTIKNILRGIIDDAGIAAAGIMPNARPETLTIIQFANLAQIINPISLQTANSD